MAIEQRPLGDFVSLTRGVSWGAAQERSTAEPGTYAVLRIPNIQDRLVLDDLVRVKISGESAEGARATPGTIIMVGSNGNPRRVGNPVFIDHDDGFLFASFLMAARLKDGAEAHPKFVFHFIASPHVQDLITRSVQGSTGLKNLSASTIQELRVPALSFPEQRRIAEVLDTLDEAIRKTEQVIAKLQQMKQGLLHDLLTRGIGEDGELRDPERHPEQFKESELGSIPKDWRCIRIGELASYVGSGITPRGGSEVYLSEGVLFIRSQNVHLEGLRLDEAAFISESVHRSMSRSEVAAFDVLLNISGASIGRVCFVPGDIGPANVNQHVCIVRLPQPSKVDSRVLSSILASEIGQQQIYRLNAGGNREGLNYEQLRGFYVPWPPMKERSRMAGGIAEAEERIAVEEQLVDKLSSVKHGLMHDLLTGQARVRIAEEATA